MVAGAHGEVAGGRIGREASERVVALAEDVVQDPSTRTADAEVGGIGCDVGPVRPPGSAVAELPGPARERSSVEVSEILESRLGIKVETVRVQSAGRRVVFDAAQDVGLRS